VVADIVIRGGTVFDGSGAPGFDLAKGFASNGYDAHSPGQYNMMVCFITEVVMTMMFLFIIMGATHGNAPAGFAPLAIGLALVMIHLVSIPVTNTSVNPARSTGPALFVGGWALAQLWLFWIAPLIGGKFGRRPVYFGLCLSSLLVCSFLFRGFSEYSGAFLATVGLVGMCTAAFYGWLPQYLPELFPTRVRATGQGLAFNFGRILAAAGAWQMGSLMAFFDKSYARAGATIVLVYLVGMGLIWLAPETRDKPLPE